MDKRFVLCIGLFVCVYFLFEANVFALSFTEQTYEVGVQPDSVAVNDLNGDGKLDLAVANSNSNTVSILLGNGDGTFGPAATFSAINPQSVAVDDFNGDGKLDLAVASGNSGGVSILLGNGDGSFQSAVNYTAGGNASFVATDDFNKDGKLDLAVASGNSGGVSILLGNGDGSFQSAVNYTAGTNTSSVAKGDFDKDGKLDLAAANKGSNTVTILFGNGDGTFPAAINYAVNSPQSIVVDDFNKDGKLDLAVAGGTSNGVSILLGNGDGTFQSAVSYTAGTNTSSVAKADFDGDGKLDLAATNSGSKTVSVLLGNGDGTFQSPDNHSVGSTPLSVAVGDFNEDGKPDLAVANSGNNTVSILLNTTSVITVPGAPTGVKAVAGDESATVSFKAPASSGGSPITSYTVTSHPDGITENGASSPINVLGLTNGATYTFAVTATNAIGTGPASSPSNKVTPGPMISVKPMSVNFGPLGVGSTSVPKTVTIKSVGSVDLVISSVSVSGANQAQFAQTNSCTTVPAQGSCPITVTFAPAMPFGKESAILVISSNDPNKPTINVKLLGKAAPPKLSVAPGSVHLASTQVGSMSAPKIVTIKNRGRSDLIISSIIVTGTDTTEFIQTNDCSTIATGSSCAISIIFSPVSAGKKNAIIAISSNDPKKPTINVRASGKGKT